MLCRETGVHPLSVRQEMSFSNSKCNNPANSSDPLHTHAQDGDLWIYGMGGVVRQYSALEQMSVPLLTVATSFPRPLVCKGSLGWKPFSRERCMHNGGRRGQACSRRGEGGGMGGSEIQGFVYHKAFPFTKLNLSPEEFLGPMKEGRGGAPIQAQAWGGGGGSSHKLCSATGGPCVVVLSCWVAQNRNQNPKKIHDFCK